MIDKEILIKYSEAGLKIFPCHLDKSPNCPSEKDNGNWKTYEFDINDLDRFEMIGCRMGSENGNMFCIDFDTKNSPDANLFKKYCAEIPDEILQQPIVQQTVSGGYHFLFKCDNPLNNAKFARTADGKTVIESRGTGGYVILAPSDGYSLKRGSFDSIPHISDDVFWTLVNTAYIFDSYVDNEIANKVYRPKGLTEKYKPTQGTTPWDDFSNNTDATSLIESYGWSKFREHGDRIYFTREGKSTGISADFHRGYRLFKSLTSNCEPLKQDKGYTLFMLYSEYEHGGDYSAAAKQLYEDGWGDRLTKEEEKNIEGDNPFEHISDWDKISSDLEDYYSGKIEKGASTGSKLMDRYIPFKKNHFVMLGSHTGTGKTFVISYIIALAIKYPNWRWICAMQENMKWDTVDTILSFMNANSAERMYKKQTINFKEQLSYLKGRIKFVNSGDKSVFEVMDIAESINKSEKAKGREGYDALLLDPNNSFKIDVNKNVGFGFEYHSQAGARMLDFSNNSMSLYLTSHFTNGGQRNAYNEDKDGKKKRRVPRKEDIEYYGSYGNKAHTIIIVDRDVNDEDKWHITKLWNKKNRTEKLGGAINPDEKPLEFWFDKHNFGFTIKCGYEEESNPLLINDFSKVAELSIQDNNLTKFPPTQAMEGLHTEYDSRNGFDDVSENDLVITEKDYDDYPFLEREDE